jgi:7,8-dihydropterin-6-yl-methyl-4-(beta-D-ribofuranosyl)aminobenzene 5'-phosphate synthase
MNLKFLYDNQFIGKPFISDWGFSCLINNEILFDTGAYYSLLEKNAELLDAELSKVRTVVISHEHWDHTGGLWGILKINPRIKVCLCPGFSSEFKNKLDLAKADYDEISGYTNICKNIYSTGELVGTYKAREISEQSIIIALKKGVGVITGCAHPGILNVAQQVKDMLKINTIEFLFGGFHLKDKKSHEISEIAAKLKSIGVKKIGPCHCSGLLAQETLKNLYKKDFSHIGAGKIVKI